MDAICFFTTFQTMGWKWTLQDPYPIHLSHKNIWELHCIPHFYKIFHVVVLPLHQIIFNKKAPRFSQEAATHLLTVGKYFIEEWFTYIRAFGITSDPHVLPLYVSDKLLAREIAYQTMGKGLTKFLKDEKKSLWPSFPVKCGSFALSNFVHATGINTYESLRLHTFPKRQFDPKKVAYNVITRVKLKPYNHDDNYFEVLLQSVVSFEQVFEWEKSNLKPEEFQRFQEFRDERLRVILMHLLKPKYKSTPSVTIDSGGPSSQVDSQVNTEKAQDIGKPQDTANTAESSKKSAEKQVMSTPTIEIGSESKGDSLE